MRTAPELAGVSIRQQSQRWEFSASGANLASVSLARKNPFLAGALEMGGRRLELPRQAEHGVLAGPLDWRIAQTFDANTAWQSALDSRLHKIRCKERERYGDVDLTDSAALSLGNPFGACCCIGKKFIKPSAAPCN